MSQIRVILLAGGLIAAAGCASAENEAPVLARSQDARFAIRNQGYGLFYKLMADESNVSKLLLIKKEQKDLGDLLRKISEVTGDIAKDLEKLSKADGELHLNFDGLPTVEKETRELIGKTRAKELIAKGGEKFELRILLTQSEALTYGAHLAAAIQKHESNPARQKFLGAVSQRLQELHQAVIDMMHTRWDSPAKR